MSKEYPTPLEARKKLEYFCAYQERCHEEVISKLRSLGIEQEAADEIIVYLINNNFLNESRFAQTFARGKHSIKFWGKLRIVRELKARGISSYNIELGLKEIDAETYDSTFETLAQRIWESLPDTKILAKKKKWCDYLFRKGYENHLIMDKLQILSKK